MSTKVEVDAPSTEKKKKQILKYRSQTELHFHLKGIISFLH